MPVFEYEDTIYIHLNIFLDESKFPIRNLIYWETKNETMVNISVID